MALISRKLLSVRPQELGKIKIGGHGRKIPRGDSYFFAPVKYDHFVVTTRNRVGESENFEKDAAIHALIGAKPTTLDAVLMYPTPEENFHAEMVRYKGKKKVWTCNGETARNLERGTAGPCQANEAGEKCKCGSKPYARLHLQLTASPHMLGYHVFRSTSWETTNNIQTALEQIVQTFGTCYHAPVKLVLYPSEDRHDDKTSTSYKVGLVLAMAFSDAAHRIAEARQYAQLAGGPELRRLSAGVMQDLDAADVAESEQIAEEFFPDLDDRGVHALETSNALHAPDPEPRGPGELVSTYMGEPATEEEQPAAVATDPLHATPDATPAEDTPVDDRQWSEIAETAPSSDFDKREDLEGAEARPTRAELERSLGAADNAPPPGSSALTGHLSDLGQKYAASLAARGILDVADRAAFEARLLREGKVTTTPATWTKQDLRSAIAELETTDAGNTGADDDDLFQG